MSGGDGTRFCCGWAPDWVRASERAAEKALSEVLKLSRKTSAIATASDDTGPVDASCAAGAAALLLAGKMPGGINGGSAWDAAGLLRDDAEAPGALA